MKRNHITALIEQYDSGNRSPLLALQVYTALADLMERTKGRKISKAEIDNWDFEDSKTLASGIAVLRREYNLEPTTV